MDGEALSVFLFPSEPPFVPEAGKRYPTFSIFLSSMCPHAHRVRGQHRVLPVPTAYVSVARHWRVMST